MPSWLGGFVNPGLALGAALAAVPLIIHLLNRQRHKPVEWAAMRFVLAAYKQTRRRVQMENLLLLLMRMAILALLAFCVARPFTGQASPLAGLTESRRDVVLVVDASASTGYREDVETVFERIVDRARAIVRDLEASRGDRVRLIVASRTPRLLSWTTPDKALSMLDTLTAPSDEPLDLTAALGEVLEIAREDAAGTERSGLEVRLLSDLQRRSFAPALTAGDAGADDAQAPDGQAGGTALVEQLDALAALSVRVLVEDLGPQQPVPPNLGVASVAPLGDLLGAGDTNELRVLVRNHGPSPRNGVRVALVVDGARRPTETVDVPARGQAEVVFPVVFTAPGEHVIRAELDGDRLTIDDARDEVVLVPPPVRVLLVDGDPSAEIDRDEVGFLAAVLDPMPDDGGGFGAAAPFEPRIVDPLQLAAGEVDPADFDVVWLANVETLPPRLVDDLEARVAAGAALVLSLGDRVVPETWNARLWRADGSGLLPAELGARVAVPDRRRGYFRVAEFDADYPAFAFFAEDRWKPLLTEVPIYEAIASRPLDSARVLARLDDGLGTPLLVERAYDRGTVALWTTTIDPAWTRLPESPRTLVPFVHDLVRHLAREDGPPRNVAPGAVLVTEVDGFPRSSTLIRPDATRRPLEGEAEEVAPGRYRLPPVSGRETATVGVYRIESDARRRQSLAFAVRFDAGEGDLARMAAGELDALHPALLVLAPGDDERARDEGGFRHEGELWRQLAWATLAFLVAESLFAAWLGGRRKAVR